MRSNPGRPTGEPLSRGAASLAGRVSHLLLGRSLAGAALRFIGPAAIAPVFIFLLLASRVPYASVISLALAASGAVASAFVLSRHLGWPLARMTATVHQLPSAAETFCAEPPVREFRDLARAINSTTTRFRESNARLVDKAFHDPLTGLPNRALFMHRIQEALGGNRDRAESVAVLFFDLDRFKVLNDTLGHVVGDRLLVMFSRRLGNLVNESRLLARLAGDEFILLIRSRRAESEALELAAQITSILRRPLSVDGRELFITTSIGIAVANTDDTNGTDLLRRADIALYRAKADGRARYALFDPDIDLVSVEQLDLDTALRRAVQRRQLLLYYQPIVDLATRDIVGLEALLRWNHPHRGILSPADFISLAEETGEIVNIGKWVLEEACRKAADLSRRLADSGRPSLIMSLNVSAAEFWQPGLVENVRRILAETKIDPGLIRIEITESVLVDDIPNASELLAQLRDQGVKLAIDDFGTGYSSFSYLQHLPVDTLKIDQSFIRPLGHDDRSLPIVEAIVNLGHALGMQVTAEGIETARQLQCLRTAGCQLGQGHYFSPAQDTIALDKLIERSAGRRKAG